LFAFLADGFPREIDSASDLSEAKRKTKELPRPALGGDHLVRPPFSSHVRSRVSSPYLSQAYWVNQALTVLGTLFGGATAFPQGRGIWRDDAQDGKLLFDEPMVIQCYTREETLERQAPGLRDFLYRIGREAHQGAVGFVIDRDYLEIGFPLKEPSPSRPKHKKRR